MEKTYHNFYLILMLLVFGTACNKTVHSSASTESSPLNAEAEIPREPSYQGYRLELVNVATIDEQTIQGTLVNTGRYKVQLPPSQPASLIIAFDETLSDQGLDSYESSIQAAILQQSLSLEPGQILYDFSTNLTSTTASKPTEPTPSSTTTSSDFQDFCPDLQIDTFFVSKRTKKYAEITYKITNIGKGPAELYGPTKNVEDNVAVRAYASGTKNLSRGDLIIGGDFIEKGIKKQKGLLPPTASYEGTFKIDIKKKTKHMPYIIIAIDDYQSLWECEERNNVKELLYR